jgi:hypothetical protein
VKWEQLSEGDVRKFVASLWAFLTSLKRLQPSTSVWKTRRGYDELKEVT